MKNILKKYQNKNILNCYNLILSSIKDKVKTQTKSNSIKMNY